MKHALRLMIALGIAVVIGSPAFAQAPAVPPSPPETTAVPSPSGRNARVFASLNVFNAYQARAQAEVPSASEFPLYDENAQVSTAQMIDGKGGLLDVSGGVRVLENFGIGVGFTRMSQPGSGSISAKIPHPLLFDSPRTASADVRELVHTERAVHVMALYMLRLRPNVDVTLSAGPSFFTLEQDVVGNVQVAEVGSPYTAVRLTAVDVASVTTNRTGFNVGVDATYSLTKHFGVGGFLRYAGAEAEVKGESGPAVKVDVGGVQFGGGLRLRF